MPALPRPLQVAASSLALLSGCNLVLDFDSLTRQQSPATSGGNGGSPLGGTSATLGGAGASSTAGAGSGATGGRGGNGGSPVGSGPELGGGGAFDDAGTPASGSGGTPPATGNCANGPRDCGGNGCPLCAVDDECGNDAHCLSFRCENGLCRPAECSDGRTNGNETDEDCGGPDCDACSVGKTCKRTDDCELLENSVPECRDDGEEMTCASECAGDYLNCDSNEGCEVDPMTDVDNCGDCDVACNADNGMPSCSDGECEITCSDPTHYDDCNDSAADGCETDVTTTPEHCGACNAACSHECIEGNCCRELTSASVEYDVTGCFVVRPDDDCDVLTVQNKGPTIAYTLVSDCNETTSGTLSTNATVNFSHCEVRFELASDTQVRMSWWQGNCR